MNRDSMDIGEPIIVVEITLELPDCLEAIRAREPLRDRLQRWGLSISGMILIAALLLAPFSMKEVPGEFVAFLLAVLPTGVVMAIWPWYKKPDWVYKRTMSTYQFPTSRAEVGGAGFRSIYKDLEITIAWERMCGFTETKNTFSFRDDLMYYIFPKRVFAPGEADRFRELVQSGMVKKDTTPRFFDI
jgi:hypothetical protein